MKTKTCFSFFIIGLLLLVPTTQKGAIPNGVPILFDISLNTQNVGIKEYLNISIDVEENFETGLLSIQVFLSGEVVKKVNTQPILMFAEYSINENSGNWEIMTEIIQDWPDIIRVGSLLLNFVSGGDLEISVSEYPEYFQSSAISINTGNEEDVLAPELNSVQFTQTLISSGQETRILVNVTDDSGILYNLANDETVYVNISDPVELDKRSLDLEYNQTSGLFEKNIPFGIYDSDSYEVKSISVADIWGNSIDYFSGIDYDPVYVNVTGTTPDFTIPELHELNFTKTYIETGEKLKLRVNATDDLSGINVIFGYYGLASNPNKYSIALFSFNATSGYYEKEIQFTSINQPGPIVMHRIDIYDHASNVAHLENNIDFNSTEIIVNSVDPDNEGPKLEFLEFNKNVANFTDEITIKVITSEALPSSKGLIEFSLISINSIDTYQMEFSTFEDKSIPIQQLVFDKWYDKIEVTKVILSDNFGNIEEYTPNDIIFPSIDLLYPISWNIFEDGDETSSKSDEPGIIGYSSLSIILFALIQIGLVRRFKQ